MKQTLKNRFFIGLMLIAALLSSVPTSVFAAGNSVALTPASGTSQLGSTFTLSADGFAVGSWWGSTSSVSGSITFPANLLKVTSISTTGTSFPNGASVTPNNTNGTITFSGSCSGWFCGYSNQNVHLFAVTFQSLSPGTANVNFNNVQYNTGAAAMTGGTYTIAAPPPPPPPPPPPSPSPSPTPKPSPKPSTSPKPTPKPSIAPTPTPSVTPTPEETPTPVVESDGGLKIQGVKITTNRQENTVTWAVNNSAADTTFSYGTSKNNQKSDGQVAKKDDGSYEVSLTDLKPGTLYYFTIKASTSDNLQGATYSGVLTTRGYPVQLTIQQNNLLLPGAKVKIDERNFVANVNAIITTELSDGSHTAVITPPDGSDAQTTTFTVARKTIPKNGNPDTQSFTLNIDTVGTTSEAGTLALPFIGGAAAIITVTSFIGFLLFRRRQQANEDTSEVDSDLLAATYGTAIDQYRNNTPEPNLEAVNAAQQQSTESAFAPQSNVAPTATIPSAQIMPPQEQPLTDTPPSNAPQSASVFDPTSLPLPPTPDPNIASTSTAPEPVADLQGYSETEQLSTELAQVESGQQIEPVTEPSAIEPSEPSAIYDESTGELDILHHHSEVTPQDTPDLNTQTDPSYLQISQPPPPLSQQTDQYQPDQPSPEGVAPTNKLPPQSIQPPLTAI